MILNNNIKKWMKTLIKSYNNILTHKMQKDKCNKKKLLDLKHKN